MLYPLLLALMITTQAAQAIHPAATGDVQLPQHLNAWLSEGDHQDIPWKVHLHKPLQTFQLREVARVSAKIDAAMLQAKSIDRKLIFVIKVADAAGKWLPGENSVSQSFDKSLGTSTDVEMESEVLLSPGKYTIAAIMYDSVLDQHDVSFLPIEIDPPKNDPIPQLLSDMPEAEFVRDDVKGLDTFGRARPKLPLRVRRAVQIDLLVDLSTREQQARVAPIPGFFSPRGGTPVPPRLKPLEDNSYYIRLMQSASVLTSLTPDRGCVQVSALDATQVRVVLQRTPAGQIDWVKVRDAESGLAKKTVSIAALAGRHDSLKFFVYNLNHLIAAEPCKHDPSTLHIVIILGHGLETEDNERLKAEACDCKVFYLRQSDTLMNSDRLKGTLSPLSPRMLDFHTPEQFRQRLGDLIHEIEQLAQ